MWFPSARFLLTYTDFWRPYARFETIICLKMVRFFWYLNLRKYELLTHDCVWQLTLSIRFFRLLSELSQVDSPGVFIGPKLVQVCCDYWFGGALGRTCAHSLKEC
jgi:hypothetical protein